MINLYDEFETNFDYIGIPLKDVISAKVVEEANGMFELEIEYPRDKVKEITEGNIIKCNTHRGKQLFRIYRVVKTLQGLKIYARHITYDLLDNFIEDIRPTKTGANNAIRQILNNTQYKHPFTGSSDIDNTATAYYIRKNPIQCLVGDEDNSFVNRWGGEIVRDNFSIKMKARGGVDRGYEIRLGKNLIGIEEDIDITDVVTRLYPTVVINQVVHHLPEKYIDSPLMGKYRNPTVKETRMNLPQEYQSENEDEKVEVDMEEIYDLMREHCKNLYKKGKIDQPHVNYKVDFVELSKTEQYKDLKLLEQVDLYDIVHVHVSELNINVDAKVIKVVYDVLKDKYEKLELGSFKKKLTDNSNKMKNYVDNEVGALNSDMQKAIDNATKLITGAKGGYRVDRLNAEGKPYETLYMDTDNIQTATNVIRINQNGIGFSNSGYNGPYETAMTIDGKIVADYITAGTLNAGLVKAGVLSSKNELTYINMDNGTFNLADRITFDGENLIIDVTGTQIEKDINNIQGDMDNVKSRVSSAEQKITPNAITSIVRSSIEYKNDLGSKASKSDVSEINSKISSTESSIVQLSDQIESKVSYTNYNGNTIVSKINQTANSVTIDANKIDLTGVTKIYDPNNSSSYAEFNGSYFDLVYNDRNIFKIHVDAFAGVDMYTPDGSPIEFHSPVYMENGAYFSGDVDFTGASVTGLDVVAKFA